MRSLHYHRKHVCFVKRTLLRTRCLTRRSETLTHLRSGTTHMLIQPSGATVRETDNLCSVAMHARQKQNPQYTQFRCNQKNFDQGHTSFLRPQLLIALPGRHIAIGPERLLSWRLSPEFKGWGSQTGCCSQSLQYALIKEYTLKYSRILNMI